MFFNRQLNISIRGINSKKEEMIKNESYDLSYLHLKAVRNACLHPNT